MAGRIFIFGACFQIAGWWLWVAIIGLISPHWLFRKGVRFERTGKGAFKVTYTTGTVEMRT